MTRYQGFGSIKMSTDGANAHYNGLQVDLNSQIKRDLSLRVFYTLSRSYDSPTKPTVVAEEATLCRVSNPYEGWQVRLVVRLVMIVSITSRSTSSTMCRSCATLRTARENGRRWLGGVGHRNDRIWYYRSTLR